MNVLKRAYAAICRLEVVIGAVLLITTFTVIFFSAISRRLGYPVNWAIDIALLVFSWSVFLGADVAYREDKLVNVDFVINSLKPRTRRVVQLILYLLILAFLGMLIFYGIRLSYRTRFRTFQGIPALSYTWVTLSIPISSLLMTVTTALKIRAMFDLTASADAPAIGEAT